MNKRLYLLLIIMLAGFGVRAQQIVYSEAEKDDSHRINFEVVGKLGNNFIIYKSNRSRHWVSVLNNDMQPVARKNFDFLPNGDRVINVDIIPYASFFYVIYQYQRKGIVYCEAARLNETGDKIGDVMLLDTTRIGYTSDNKIYTTLYSEDKSKIVLYKINSKNKKMFQLTTRLLDDNLQTIKLSRLGVPMEERDYYLGEFTVDNDGDLFFARFNRLSNESISKVDFIQKPAMADELVERPVNIEGIYLDDIKNKADNINKRMVMVSFYNKTKRGNIEGYYLYVWDKKTNTVIREKALAFSENLRKEAKGNTSSKAAFDDNFIKNIILKGDGGFIIASESAYTSSRGGGWNRWNYWGSPFMRPFDYYYYSPFYSNAYWGLNRWGNNGDNVRYQADNITISSFDSQGNNEWNNVITKEQFNDQSDNLLSYQLFNTGGQLHFLFNTLESKAQLLSDFTVSPEGEMKRNPTLKNLDRGREFMPRYGKQVARNQMIIPCLYRNYICFAKVDYN